VVVEFGAGSARKTPHLLRAIEPSAYVPIDISGEYLQASSAALASSFPGLPVMPVVGDFNRELTLPNAVRDLPALGFFPGSTIGNMEPDAAVDLLRTMRSLLGEDAMLLIGMDRIKDADRLIAAYDDAAGVTAAFNLNLLTRRYAGGGFRPPRGLERREGAHRNASGSHPRHRFPRRGTPVPHGSRRNHPH
jgi:uncharacterized SAM-dependent methyltransferase